MGVVFVRTSTISSATRSNSAAPKPREVGARAAEADAGGVPGAVRVGRDGVAVGDHARIEQRRLGLPPGEPVGRHVDQDEVVVGATGHQGGPARGEALGERLCVVGHLLRVDLERGLPRLDQRHGLGRHHVGQRPAEDHRAAAVDVGGELLLGQHHPAARSAQGLVRGGGDHVRVGHRVLVAGEHLAGDQTGEVRHVDHQHRADLVGDLPHLREVHPAG